jgi:hypothetical protein
MGKSLKGRVVKRVVSSEGLGRLLGRCLWGVAVAEALMDSTAGRDDAGRRLGTLDIVEQFQPGLAQRFRGRRKRDE